MSNRLPGLIFLAGGLIGTSAIAQQAGPAEERQSVPELRTVAPVRTAPARPEPARTAQELASGVDVVPAESVAKDLQTVVVLCATQPGSEEFRTEWVRYVRAHAVAEQDLDALIDDVLARAQAHRSELLSSPRRGRMLANPATIKASMHDTAKAAINNVR